MPAAEVVAAKVKLKLQNSHRETDVSDKQIFNLGDIPVNYFPPPQPK